MNHEYERLKAQSTILISQFTFRQGNEEISFNKRERETSNKIEIARTCVKKSEDKRDMFKCVRCS